MRGQHANRQGAALTVPALLARALAELAAERAALARERAELEAERALLNAERAPAAGRHAARP